MPDFVDRLGAALLDAGLAATAIAGFVVLAMIQSRQPARRRGWARAGLLSTLALLPLAALNPVPRLDLRGPLRAILPTAFDEPNPRPAPPRDWHAPPDLPPADAELPPPSTTEGLPAPPTWLRWAGRFLVGAYLAGLSVGLGWIALGLWGTALVVRRASMPSPQSARSYAALPFDSVWSRPRLLVSDRTTRPVLLGVTRPVILIPPDLDLPGSAERLRLGLLHELAHAEWGDHRLGPAATLAQAIWFFLPPVWWIRDQMRLDQEFLADRRAVAHFGTSGGYASSLVDLAEAIPAPPDGPSPEARPASSPGVASALFQRVLMLVRCPFAIEGRTPLWWRWSTASTLALATLAASCLTLRGFAGWATSPAPTPAESPRSFRIPQLSIGQKPGEDQPFDLRFRLPEAFTLTFEILAEPADLPALEVLGHRLGPACDIEPATASYRLWHSIRIRRASGSEVVEVDGRPVAGLSRFGKPAPWLTIRPTPGKATRIRDLNLFW